MIMQNKKISIIGIGLIGGSLAKALKKYLKIADITAINRSPDSIQAAVKDGTITRGFTELNEYVYNSDIIFICTPVSKTKEYIEKLAPKVKKDTIITDVGSTKAEIIDFANNIPLSFCFIGGHPMTGSEKSGYKASICNIFENTYYILTKSKSSNQKAIQCMIDILNGIGAIPILLDAEEHDMITATISHVPHILASTLVNMVKDLDNNNQTMKALAAGGFKDITRIASSDPYIWENIILSNKEKIKGILETYVEYINKLKDHINNSDSQKISSFFASAKKYRDSFE